MKKIMSLKYCFLIVFTCFVSSITIAQDKNSQTLPFEKMSNYFVLHSIPSGKTKLMKITNQKEFDAYFGMAATMGEEGKPSPINFDTHFVLAIVYSYTNQLIDIIPVQLNQTAKKKAQFQYQLKSNGSQSAISRPITMIKVNKQFVKFKFELQQVK